MFIAMGPFCWGRGETVERAIENMKKEWPGHIEEGGFSVYECEDPGAEVSETGGITRAAGTKVERVKDGTCKKRR